MLSLVIGQSNYYQADPFYSYNNENYNYSDSIATQILDIRPLFKRSTDKQIYFSYKTWFFYNDNSPNLENTSDIWVAKGLNFFQSIHFDFSNSFISMSIQPFTYITQNLIHNSQFTKNLDAKYTVLNDGVISTERPYTVLRLRESQLYLHKKGFGIGVSNANMWWGPGIHNSLTMTNNTTGFPHFMVGSISEQRWKNVGFNFRQIFTKFYKNNPAHPFFTALLGSIRIYSEPIISIGLIRTFLSGGNISDENISVKDAILIPFQSFFKRDLSIENDFLSPQDDVDQLFSGYINMLFPKSKLKLYLEYGWNDHRWDWHDFRAYPDHSVAICTGFRKYGIFNNPDYMFGFEYYNNTIGRIYNGPSPSWYGKEYFHYSTYNGRRFAAHSGSNSDDLLFYFGKINQNNSLILSFNYERHGLEKSLKTKENIGQLPEVKFEVKLDYRYKIKNYNLLLFYEFEYLENVGFEYSRKDLGLFFKDIPVRKSNVIGIGFERDLSGLFK